MPWPEIVGHEGVIDSFRRNLQQARLASTFLFVGPPGIGKWTTALSLAQALLCESTPADVLDACQNCPACQQVAAQTHPDMILVRKPADKNFIPVELFIGDREHRMREGMCHDISLKPFRGGRKIAIIDDADFLNQEGANCLLKTLEEPPAHCVIILISSSEQRQLPTIRSRCQIIRFSSLSAGQVATLLRREALVADDAPIEQLAARAEGSLRRAIALADPELEDARRSLLQQLSQADFDAVSLGQGLSSFVDAAGKDASPRRERTRQLVQAAASYYRHLMRHAVGAGPSGDPLNDQAIATAQQTWSGQALRASECLERCHEALAQVDANANLGTLIPCWIDDLARLSLQATSVAKRTE